MPETCTNIKAILEDLQGKGLSSTAKLVAILESCGIEDRAEIAALIEIGSSTLRTAKSALKNERSKTSTARNQALENEHIARNQAQTLENERSKTSVSSRAHANKELPSEVVITQSVSQTRANVIELEPAGWSDLKTAFNGSTEAMLADVQSYMGPLARRSDAVKWLSGTVSAYGAQRTAQAWTIITTKRAQGEIVANPLPLWAKTAGGLKNTSAPPKRLSRW